MRLLTLRFAFIFTVLPLLTIALLPSCKSCNKKDEAKTVKTDSLATAPALAPPTMATLPHADTTLIPVLSKILDEAFDASINKDYNKLGSLILYKGPNEKRFGTDVFNAKNAYERNVVRITSDVFNKWNKNIQSRDYPRIFQLDQPDGSQAPVLEVLFLTTKTIDRKFFIFLPVKGEYKIAEVTSGGE